MNITSSIPLLNPPSLQNLHKIYVKAKDEESNIRKSKPKSKIRIKSKSQSKFTSDVFSQKNTEQVYKTINLLAVIRESKQKNQQDKQNMVLFEDPKISKKQREILFLKQLISRRRLIPTVQQKHQSRSRSQSVTHLSLFRLPKQGEQENKKQSSKVQNALHQIGMVSEWSRKANQYQHYDNVVKGLLGEINERKIGNRTQRNSFSPSKLDPKQKLIQKLQANLTDFQPASPTLCNFKAAFKLLPKKQNMIFRLSELTADNVYDKKICSYIHFLYKINFSNRSHSDLSLSNSGKVYKVKIGKGNNSQLVKMLIKRRFWWQIENTTSVSTNKQDNKLSFIWTQSTNQNAHKLQQNSLKNELLIKNQDSENTELVTKKAKKLKRSVKKINNQNNLKVLHNQDIEECQQYFCASNYGLMPVHNKTVPEIVSNHIPSNFIIGSKKILFMVLHWYNEHIKKTDPFTYLPLTYHMKSGEANNISFQNFLKAQSNNSESVWIVKPGENTNRGNGINVTTFNQVSKLIKRKELHKNGEEKTYIVQKYIKPFLYNGRKFDIRHYLLITSVKGNIKAYWYKEGYIRTASEKYDLEDLNNEFVHLTNDAVQKKSELYGKYQPGNKLSYVMFQRYLDQNYPHKKYSLETQILNKMKQITTDLIHASFSFLDPQRKSSNFQLYGMDFMIDHKFDPYLIEVNANPCLEISCPVLERIIPTLLEHTFRVGLDPIFPPPEHYPINCRYQLSDRILEKLKYELIFDEKHEADEITQKIKVADVKFPLPSKNKMEPDQEIFQDQGEQNPKNIEID